MVRHHYTRTKRAARRIIKQEQKRGKSATYGLSRSKSEKRKGKYQVRVTS